MKIARLLTVLAASSLAGIAYAQTQPAPSNQPNAAPGYNTAHPHERRMTTVQGANESAPAQSRSAPGSALSGGQTRTRSETLRTAEAGPSAGGHWSNMPVQSSSGQSLGSVSKVVPGLNGRRSSGYVLVSGSDGQSVAVPYPTANHMVRDGKLVLSQSRFDHAPKVTRQDLKNNANRTWRVKADHYWMHEGKGHGQMQSMQK